MAKRGNTVLIGVAIIAGVILARGCIRLVNHTSEPQVIEISRDASCDYAEQLVQLSWNQYSRGLTLKCHRLGKSGDIELPNHSTLRIQEGDRYEGGPSRKGLVKGDKLAFEEPMTFELYKEGNNPQEPAVRIDIQKDGYIRFWGIREGVANIIIPIRRDSRIKWMDDGKNLGVLIINVVVSPKK
ncbi:MAG: hypothetical protein WC451_03740 [Patescibacteria group bacterium]